jgi:dTDP-4-dehydrorhamnose 3,5-epimerase
MKVLKTSLPGVLIIEPTVFGDNRGFFYESWNAQEFQAAGVDATFAQDNHSGSARHVLRGLHYQVRRPQGKLVRVVAGEVFDVAVDLRRSSPTFGRWQQARLSSDNRRMLWIPPGFAHGFLVTSEWAELLYKTTDYRVAEYERTIAWNDPDLAIDWPIQTQPILSAKDAEGLPLARAETYP